MKKQNVWFVRVIVILAVVMISTSVSSVYAQQSGGMNDDQSVQSDTNAETQGIMILDEKSLFGAYIGFFGLAIAVALAGFGSAIGIGYAAQAANGVMSENPKEFGKYLSILALPGTQGIYGFVIAYMAFAALQTAVLNGGISIGLGIAYAAVCLPVGLGGMISGIHQGKACASGIMMVSKQPDETGKAITMAVFIEFYAILGFLISILALGFLGNL